MVDYHINLPYPQSISHIPYVHIDISFMSDLLYGSPIAISHIDVGSIAISHIDVGSYLVTLAQGQISALWLLGKVQGSREVGWCRLIVSRPALKAPMLSALETGIS